MAKIKVKNPVVELDGDEMTRIIWSFIKEQLIVPYLDVQLDYYDLGIEHRDATGDRVTVEAAEAIKRHGVGVKCATITPDEARVQEFGLKKMYRSPNGTIRNILGGVIFREPIVIANIPAAGAGLDQADRDRPPRVRRPVPRDRLARPRRGQAGRSRSRPPTAASRSSSRSTTSPAPAWRWRCTTSTTRSATSRARRCATAWSATTRCTCRPRTPSSRRYDGRFKDMFAEVYDERVQGATSRPPGITYEHRLIDDMVAAALKWEGGYVWACKNYDGDVQSDTVAQGFGSLGLMTSRADDRRRQDRRGRGRARHRHPPLPPAPAGQADLHQPDRLDLRLDARPVSTAASMDDTPEVTALRRDARARRASTRSKAAR